MTPSELAAELRRLEAGATPGPWEIGLDQHEQSNLYGPVGEWLALLPHQCVGALQMIAQTHAELIVALRNNLPTILAALEAAPAAPSSDPPIYSIGGMLDDCLQAHRDDAPARATGAAAACVSERLERIESVLRAFVAAQGRNTPNGG